MSGKDIHRWLVDLRPHAYIPESSFAVSVVLRASFAGESDYYFAGVNVENIDHRLSTHGEEGAIAAMIAGLGNQARIVELWCMGASPRLKPGDKDPAADAFATCCGKCRQQIAGLSSDDVKIHYVSLNGAEQITTVGVALPQAFRLPLATAKHEVRALTVEEVERGLARKGPLTATDIETWLRTLEPVDFMSGIAQSIVVELDNGFYVSGTRIEEAAFIDISVAQSAMAIATGAFGSFKIKSAWIFTRGHTSEGRALLSLSSLQVLSEFRYDSSLTLSYLSDGKVMSTKTLGESIIAWK